MTLPTRDPGAAAPGGIRRALLAGVTRNVIALGLVSFFTDISSELLVYLIPLYLANVLAATPTIIGVVEGVTESASAFLKLGSGCAAAAVVLLGFINRRSRAGSPEADRERASRT